MDRGVALNFLNPARRWASHAFVLFLAILFFAIATKFVFILIFFSISGEIKQEQAIFARYQELSNNITLPDNAELKLNAFKSGLEKLKKLEINDVGVDAVLNELEKGKTVEVIYTKIEYDGLGNKCILEFTAADSAYASQLLKKLESFPMFKSVTILRRDRAGNIDKYSIEIRI